MDAAIKFENTPHLAMAAYRTYLLRWVLRRFYWPLGLLAILAALIFVRADSIWSGALGGFIAVHYCWPFIRATFRPRTQWSSKQLRGMTDLSLRYTFSQAGVSFESQVTSGTLKWAAYERFYKGRKASLLVLAGGDCSYHYFPTSLLTPDVEELIKENIGAA